MQLEDSRFDQSERVLRDDIGGSRLRAVIYVDLQLRDTPSGAVYSGEIAVVMHFNGEVLTTGADSQTISPARLAPLHSR